MMFRENNLTMYLMPVHSAHFIHPCIIRDDVQGKLLDQVPNACALCTLHTPLYIRDDVKGKLLDQVPNACALCTLHTLLYIRDGGQGK